MSRSLETTEPFLSHVFPHTLPNTLYYVPFIRIVYPNIKTLGRPPPRARASRQRARARLRRDARPTPRRDSPTRRRHRFRVTPSCPQTPSTTTISSSTTASATPARAPRVSAPRSSPRASLATPATRASVGSRNNSREDDEENYSGKRTRTRRRSGRDARNRERCYSTAPSRTVTACTGKRRWRRCRGRCETCWMNCARTVCWERMRNERWIRARSTRTNEDGGYRRISIIRSSRDRS